MIKPTRYTLDVGPHSTAKIMRMAVGMTLWIQTGYEDTLEIKLKDVDLVAQLREIMNSDDVETFISGGTAYNQTIVVDGVAD
tara:strand:- start:314 stop:559 length:246 start_codon:yes stop_codon:yes gene_type:complete